MLEKTECEEAQQLKAVYQHPETKKNQCHLYFVLNYTNATNMQNKSKLYNTNTFQAYIRC